MESKYKNIIINKNNFKLDQNGNAIIMIYDNTKQIIVKNEVTMESKYVTHKELNDILDKRFDEFEVKLDKKLDEKLDKKWNEKPTWFIEFEKKNDERWEKQFEFNKNHTH